MSIQAKQVDLSRLRRSFGHCATSLKIASLARFGHYSIDDRGTYERSTWTKSIKGLKSYKQRNTYILSPVRSHGQNSKPRDNIKSAEQGKANPEA